MDASEERGWLFRWVKSVQEAKQYEEMVRHMTEIAHTALDYPLNSQERTMLYSAFQYLIEAPRRSWRYFSNKKEDDEIQPGALACIKQGSCSSSLRSL
ncbi:hypothetical protein AMTRI_Chr04g183040 [Amborella trichopoda]|uniref:14-3-3 domain-containing protein n=1 Tax=Amborella trichopoda TaxID=13333 RepID=W1NIQ5_AMBTC|nr:hypothetical protein AMTR_s00008p00165280 [Amborella trichopoda]